MKPKYKIEILELFKVKDIVVTKFPDPDRRTVQLFVVEFSEFVKSKGATLYCTFPPYLDHSFKSGKSKIDYYEKQLHKQPLTILGRPEDYAMPSDLIFDMPYHLNKVGATKRTLLLIDDLKIQMQKDHIK